MIKARADKAAHFEAEFRNLSYCTWMSFKIKKNVIHNLTLKEKFMSYFHHIAKWNLNSKQLEKEIHQFIGHRAYFNFI